MLKHSNPALKNRLLTLLLFLLVSCSGVPAPPAPSAMPGTLVLVNGILIDGTGTEPLLDGALLIQGERILAAGARSQVSIPAGARVIDVGGASILPGFINAHVHDAYSARNLEAWAQAGVTTVRDEGILSALALSDAIQQRDEWSGQPSYARLVSGGYMLSAPDGYGSLYATSVEDASQKVAEELQAGADLIKFSMEDGYGAARNLPLLSAEEIGAIVSAAHAQGRRVSAHVTEATYLKMVVDAGVDDAAHMVWDDIPQDLLGQMVADGVYVVPTLTVMEAYGALAGSQANLNRFVDAGGKVALGNDYTDIPQNNFDHFELGMPMHEITRMLEAGMTPSQIIVAATQNAAYVCGLENELGTLEAGKLADVLVVDGNPLLDVQALASVRLVIHNGAVIRDESQ